MLSLNRPTYSVMYVYSPSHDNLDEQSSKSSSVRTHNNGNRIYSWVLNLYIWRLLAVCPKQAYEFSRTHYSFCEELVTFKTFFWLAKIIINSSCHPLTLIRESWKKSKTRNRHWAGFQKKIQTAPFNRFACFGFLFRNDARSDRVDHGPENHIYFCLARHIFSHVGICHLKFAS